MLELLADHCAENSLQEIIKFSLQRRGGPVIIPNLLLVSQVSLKTRTRQAVTFPR